MPVISAWISASIQTAVIPVPVPPSHSPFISE